MNTATSLSKRRMLVTGASSGIGAAVARLAADHGAVVACVGRRQDRIKRLASDVGGVAIPGDISTPAGARDAVERAASGLGGGIDTLVNNAGLYLLGTISEGEPEDWKRMFDTNVLGLLFTTQAALPHLRASDQADIVNVSSLGGRRVARSTTSVYSATKFAVQAVTDGLRIELKDSGIRVLTILPGVVATELGTGTRDANLVKEVKEKQAAMGIPASSIAAQLVQSVAQPRDVTVREIVISPTRQQA